MTTDGKITIGIAGVAALLNLTVLTAELVTGNSDDWVNRLGSVVLALWIIMLALRIEREHDRALSAERTVKYLRERIKIMDGKS